MNVDSFLMMDKTCQDVRMINECVNAYSTSVRPGEGPRLLKTRSKSPGCSSQQLRLRQETDLWLDFIILIICNFIPLQN